MLKPEVFKKMHEALVDGRSVTLTHAELELLYELTGDALAQADSKLEKWVEALEDYQRNVEREKQREDDAGGKLTIRDIIGSILTAATSGYTGREGLNNTAAGCRWSPDRGRRRDCALAAGGQTRGRRF